MKYKVELYFTNLDNSLYTDTETCMEFEFTAGDQQHADLMAEHLQRTFQADYNLLWRL